MTLHEKYMHRVLDLAKRGWKSVYPNPKVGCVIVYKDKIISEGWHEYFGGPHAERNAINNCSEPSLLPYSTLFVNLEPCCHTGKTPPCTDLIIKSGIRKVVVGCTDPFEKVKGNGIRQLIENGVEVINGICEDECKYFNAPFFLLQEKKRPWIILKWAESSNKIMAIPGNQKWFSNDLSQQIAHKFRTEAEVVMVGSNTVRTDNPLLTVRHWKGTQPIRAVIDRNLKLKKNYHIFDHEHKTWVYNFVKSGIRNNTKWIRLSESKSILYQIVSDLYNQHISVLLVEGGPRLIRFFIKEKLYDEIRIFRSNEKVIRGIKSPAFKAKEYDRQSFGDNTLYYFCK